MTWAKLDDTMTTRHEWVQLANQATLALDAQRRALLLPSDLDPSEVARLAAKNAKHVQIASLQYAVPALTDGRITPADVDQICMRHSLSRTEFFAGAELLVRTGAWRVIRPTKREPLGGHLMLLGWAPGEQPTRKDEESRKRRSALRELLRDGRRDAPNRRDAEERAGGLCEYCDAPLGSGGQMDHVDPQALTNDLENLAHCCGKCNKKKGTAHTLEQARMAFTERAKKRRAEWPASREQGK